MTMQKLTTFLWFDHQAEDAMNFYVSVFKNSKVLGVTRYGEAGPGPKGSVMTASFEIEGQPFVALNGGPMYQFTPAVSFAINCQTQQEVDELWEKLSDGGSMQQCGWLTDRFGVTWQIVPDVLTKLLSDLDGEKVKRVYTAMFPMKKLDIRQLQNAFDGK
jgi:predicted 3-demethylubiquinone-9 3-methyltransferase (glyoxalase superfamily)